MTPPSYLGPMILVLAASTWGCSVGTGTGEISGTVTALDCDLREAPFDLDPNFFGGEVIDRSLAIRVQRGSDLQVFSDGLFILVQDSAEVRRERLGAAIDVSDGRRALVQMTLYLNETCKPGRREAPVAMVGVEGTAVFEHIYAPQLDDQDVLTRVLLENVRFIDRERPEERHAEISGNFEFAYNRGRPAQRYP